MDWQPVEVGGAALLTAMAPLVIGILTGRNQSRKDHQDARKNRDEAELAREVAQEVASRSRVEQIAADNTELRKRLRESEDDFDKRYRLLRKHDQEGWDLASYYFGRVGVLIHLFNNLFTLITMDATPERLLSGVKNAQVRVLDLKIPVHLEDPMIEDKA